MVTGVPAQVCRRALARLSISNMMELSNLLNILRDLAQKEGGNRLLEEGVQPSGGLRLRRFRLAILSETAGAG